MSNIHRLLPRSSWAALLFLFVLTLFRLWYAATHELVNDETYYWQWSRQLDWGYFDQGPAIAVVIRLSTFLFGDTAFGVRFLPILLAFASGWLIFLTASRWFGERVALWSLALLAVAPLIAVGGIVATYDNPQVFVWSAGLYALTRTVQDNRAAGWYLVGLFAGLGGMCKLTGLFLAPCVLIFLLLSPTYRFWLRTPHPYLAGLLAFFVYSPTLWWNLQHDMAPVRHGQALGSRSWGAAPLRWFWEFLGSQAIVLGPFLFLAEMYILTRLGITVLRGNFTRNSRLHEGHVFLVAFGTPVLLLCLYISLKSKMEANWPAPTHIAGLMAVAVWFDALIGNSANSKGNRLRQPAGGRKEEERKEKREDPIPPPLAPHSLWVPAYTMGPYNTHRLLIAVSVFVSFLMTMVLLFPGIVPAVGIRVSSDLAQKANEAYGWPELMRGVQAARTRLEAEGKPVFLTGINYRVPSILAFYLPDHPDTVELFLAARHDQYFYWTKPERLVGQNCLLFLDSPKPQSVALARQYFDSVEEWPAIAVYRPGFDGPVKRWLVYACRNFKGYDPQSHVEGW